MADKMMRISGRSESGLAKAIKTDELGNITTKLVERNVEKTTLLANHFLTSTNTFVTSTLDVSKYKHIQVLVSNSHDSTIKIAPMMDKHIGWWDGVDWTSTLLDKATLPANERYLILNTFFPQILDRPLFDIRFILNAETVPNTGSITIIVLGVKN